MPAEQNLVPKAMRVLKTDFERAEPAEWTQVDAVEGTADELIRRMVFDTGTPCERLVAVFEAEEYVIPAERGGIPLIAERSGDQVLVGGQGEFFLIAPNGLPTELPRLDDAPSDAAFFAADGTLWTASVSGILSKGDINGVQEVSRSPGLSVPDGGRRFIRIAGPSAWADPATPIEVFLVSSTGIFERFDGTDWELLASVQPSNQSTPNVVWIGPSEALATGVGSSPRVLTRYKDGVLIEEPLPTDNPVTSISHDPNIGTMAGTSDGELLRFTDKGWEIVREASGPPYQIFSMAPLSAGAFIAGANSRRNIPNPLLGQYHADLGYCPGEEYSTRLVLDAESFSDNRVFLSVFQFGGPALVFTLLTKVRSQISCSGTGAAMMRP